MQEKIKKLKSFLDTIDCWSLFNVLNDRMLEINIPLKCMPSLNLQIWVELRDDSFYNVITINIATIDRTKRYKALELINDLNIKEAGAVESFYLFEDVDKSFVICCKAVYTATLEKFNPKHVMGIISMISRKLEANGSINKIMQLSLA